MTRFAQTRRVYYWEEPLFDCDKAFLHIEKRLPGLSVCVPHIPGGLTQEQTTQQLALLLGEFFEDHRAASHFDFWYYTPVAFEFSRRFHPDLVVYDCMDELSAFKFAPPQLKYSEQQLLLKADVVFTGGFSLYESKKHGHSNIHAFPSSIDKSHFQAARQAVTEPADQVGILGVKLGFYGVIDERFDQELIREIALRRPDWHLMIIGPVVKIDPAELPRADNIHYLGCKSYQELPAYLAGWDVALIPFLLNESTRFISPTKTPEYLAAGRPVVSSAISDVVHPYEKMGLVSIGYDADSFIEAIEYELGNRGDRRWLNAVDQFLSDKSWEHTFNAMQQLMRAAKEQRDPVVFTSKLKSAS